MRFINPKKETYHHSLIREFTDTSRFMMSGSSKASATERFAWFADFMNKFNGNTSFNPHVGYVSFFSDHEIFISEYAGVSRLTTAYEIILSILDEKFGYEHELSTKQYARIAQRHSAFDVIEFINQSELVQEVVGIPGAHTIERFHQFYYAPVIYETGYKIDKAALYPDAQPGYDMYLWSKRSDNVLTIKDYSFTIDLTSYSTDCSPDTLAKVDDAGTDDTTRLIDCKVLPTETLWGFHDGLSTSKVHYQFDLKEEEPWSYRSHVNFPLFYQKFADGQFREIFHVDGASSSLASYLFPQICQKDVIERQKNIFISSSSDPDYLMGEGRAYSHATGLSDEEDDQSQIIYDICRSYMYDLYGSYYIGQKMDDGYIIQGIDVDTERNRRHSAIVTTEPYMKVRPIAAGQVVDYKFVEINGTDIATTPPAWNSARLLKIKAPRPFIRALDVEIGKREFNTDVMHVAYVVANTSSAIVGDNYNDYSKFSGHGDQKYYERQGYCLDDLIGGVVGSGIRYSFFTKDFTDIAVAYTGSDVKICGMGSYVDTFTDVRYTKMYCTNYVPQTLEGITRTPEIKFTGIQKYETNELFRPMLKLPGIRGFVKIIRRANFDPAITTDGNEEVIYEIEFPYCPGSGREMAYADSTYRKTQVFYKSSYINAGSWAIDSNSRYDSYNARYAPEGEKAFARIELFASRDNNKSVDTIATDPELSGGNSINIASRPTNQLQYPAYLCFEKDVNNSLRYIALTKPREFPGYEAFGTFEIKLGSLVAPTITPFLHYNADYKMVWNVDNRVWKFGENKFSSYINRENPSYVLELDISELSNEFGRNQGQYAGIPDIKRWIYAKAIAFASTVTIPPEESDTDYPDRTRDVTTQDSKSDIMIEIWDNAFPIGVTTREMWRPLSTSIYDNDKYTSQIIISGLHAALPKIHVFENLYYVVLGKFDSSAFDSGLTNDEIVAVAEQSNLVMYDSITGRMYHVAYIREDTVSTDNREIRVYFTCEDASWDVTGGEGIAVDIFNWVGPVSIHKPYSKLTRKTDFEFNSCKTVFSESELNTFLRTKYLDFGDKVNGDFSRYVSDNKIYIRIRPLRARTYPVSHGTSEDIMQYIEERSGEESIDEYTNMPWWGGSEYDFSFDWSKIDIIEYIYRFGLSYFSLQSK